MIRYEEVKELEKLLKTDERNNIPIARSFLEDLVPILKRWLNLPRREKSIAKYEVKSVVSNHGLYENGELKLICSHRRNALLIKTIMEKDDKYNSGINGNPKFTARDFNQFISDDLTEDE